MDRSSKAFIRKAGVVLAPAFLFLLFLYLILPSARKYYVKTQLDLKAVDRENVIVYAPDRDIANDVYNTFDTFRTEFLQRFDGLLNPPEKRLRIHIFKTKKDLSRYYEWKRNKPLHQNSGFYDPSDEAIAIVQSEKHVLNRAVRHEAVHYFMHSGTSSSSPDWSPWLSEGLASVYELYEHDSDSPTDRKWTLPEQGLWYIIRPYVQGKPLKKPIGAFLDIPHNKFREKDNREYYFQSRLLVCFLMNRYPDRFWDYVRYEMKNGPTGSDVFSRIIGKPDQIQQELTRWVRQVHKKMEGEIK